MPYQRKALLNTKVRPVNRYAKGSTDGLRLKYDETSKEPKNLRQTLRKPEEQFPKDLIVIISISSCSNTNWIKKFRFLKVNGNPVNFAGETSRVTMKEILALKTQKNSRFSTMITTSLPNLVHILQSCWITHDARCVRRNRVARELATRLRRLGYTVFEELRAPSSTSFIKPDLIAVRDRRATVIDVSIVLDGRGVTVWNEKKQTYGAAIISALHAIGCDVDFLVHQPMIISYRGICFPQSAKAVIGLGLPRVTVSDLCLLVIVSSLRTYDPFMRESSLLLNKVQNRLNPNGNDDDQHKAIDTQVRSPAGQLPFGACHASRGKHEGWDTARLPKPRQGKSRGRGRARTTDLPLIVYTHFSSFHQPYVLLENRRSRFTGKRLKHEAAWRSTFSCLRTSQTRDSAGFQVSLSKNQISLQMSVFVKKKWIFFG
ncbi:hypothetical protein T265_02023 [Opisthorchis viverrini]|uniref:Uncharacterized protein n=1 Tax=Opisthorchis viverrini TaxID=6198 RepID=A0A074ZXI0_OPIVI|nr:hypothetical protein T265_02023 [Opisthorchis viverrini]KER31791.1 hypothetical protein T265_02023 [Opisthorchis viverrini]